MRPLPQAVDDYLSLRRGLGFKLLRHEPCLREFASFLKEKRTSRITSQLALQFATRHQHQKPEEWAVRLTIVRQFASYRSSTDPTTEVPPHGLLLYSPKRAQPYLIRIMRFANFWRPPGIFPGPACVRGHTAACSGCWR